MNLSEQTQTQDAIKIQQLNELLITEVCKKKFLEEELEKERRQRDEYITDVIAQVHLSSTLSLHSPSLLFSDSSRKRCGITIITYERRKIMSKRSSPLLQSRDLF
jgi:hypothetical protein